MDIRLNELLNRLDAPGKPGEALSASEFSELCQLVRDMADAKEPASQQEHKQPCIHAETCQDYYNCKCIFGDCYKPNVPGEDKKYAK